MFVTTLHVCYSCKLIQLLHSYIIENGTYQHVLAGLVPYQTLRLNVNCPSRGLTPILNAATVFVMPVLNSFSHPQTSSSSSSYSFPPIPIFKTVHNNTGCYCTWSYKLPTVTVYIYILRYIPQTKVL